MELKYKRIYFDDGDSVLQTSPKNVFNSNHPEQCCLTCKHAEKLYSYDKKFKDTKIGCWHASDECGEPDHRWCWDTGHTFKCTDWMDKNTKVTPKLKMWVCRCDWDDYYDFRIIADYGQAHVRVSFYPEWVVISDLFVKEDIRNHRYATALLDYVDELTKKFAPGKEVVIVPLTDWEKEWYERRGYKVVKE